MKESILKSKTAIVGAQANTAQACGQQAEALAADHLIRHGLRILARNVRCRGGEVDIIALDGETLVFVEVRLRRSSRFGGAVASITASKRQRIILATQWWLAGAGRHHATRPCRFDAVLFASPDTTSLHWMTAAFDAD